MSKKVKIFLLLLLPFNLFAARIIIAPKIVNGQTATSIMINQVDYGCNGAQLNTFYQFYTAANTAINGNNTGEGNVQTSATVDGTVDAAMIAAVKAAVGSTAANITLAYHQLYSVEYCFTYTLSGIRGVVNLKGAFIDPATDDITLDQVFTALDIQFTDAGEVTKKWAINYGQSSVVKNAALNFTYTIDVFVDDPLGRTIYEKMLAFYMGTGDDADEAKGNMIDPFSEAGAFELQYQNGTMVLGSKGLTYGNGQWSQTSINMYHITGWPQVGFGHYIQDYIVSGQGFYNDGATETTWPYDSPDDTYITIGKNLNAAIHNLSNKKADWYFQRNGDSVQRWQQGVLSGHVYAPTDIIGLPDRTMGVGITTNAVPYVQSVLDVSAQWWSVKMTAAEMVVLIGALETFMNAIGYSVSP